MPANLASFALGGNNPGSVENRLSYKRAGVVLVDG